ncbi:ATP-dependent RNA helicase DED1 like protein [Verticillium longisporum]|nr:ATP-dependent RNA helicase DED1 like protein [Verticillium longisporum]
MLKNVEMSGYRVPTPIQQYTLAAVRKGLDIVAIAQTGSGKTAAYLVPVLDKLMGKAKKLAAPRPNPASFVPGVSQPVRAEPLVIVVCPARELAVQIFNEARKFCYRTMLRPCVAYGGGPIRDQIEQLGKGCDILIATPGRLCDFIDRPHVLTLRRVRYMIIDEADEMLHDDWGQDLNTIMSGGEQEEGNVKYLLFSATFPKDLRDLARSHLAASHSQINVGSGKTAAYLVPVLDKLMGKAKKLAAPRPNPASFVPGVSQPVRAEPLVIVVCPARELAVQIFNEARKFCYRTMLRPCVAYGGGPIRDQIEQLGKGCDILIATPGRLCDFIDRPHVLTLRRVRYMIIDEADEMLHDDWGQDLNTIMSGGEQEEGNVKYLLFSATFPKDLRDLARSHLAASHSQINNGSQGGH